jgi:hypothetical protein
MDAKQTISIIREAVEYTKSQKIELVRIENLEKLLNDIEDEIASEGVQTTPGVSNEISLARFKAQHESNLAHYNATNESSLAQYKASIDTLLEISRTTNQAGQSALKSAILINGGGAVALLAFLGHIWNSHPSYPIVSGLSCSLIVFAFGVLIAAMAAGTTYLSLFSWGNEYKRTGILFNFISILLVIISLILFVTGCYLSYKVFYSYSSF